VQHTKDGSSTSPSHCCTSAHKPGSRSSGDGEWACWQSKTSQVHAGLGLVIILVFGMTHSALPVVELHEVGATLLVQRLPLRRQLHECVHTRPICSVVLSVGSRQRHGQQQEHAVHTSTNWATPSSGGPAESGAKRSADSAASGSPSRSRHTATSTVTSTRPPKACSAGAGSPRACTGCGQDGWPSRRLPDVLRYADGHVQMVHIFTITYRMSEQSLFMHRLPSQQFQHAEQKSSPRTPRALPAR